ncbi:MAG: hypothetical protein K2O00_05440 [Muribaculaceae bacterium]|nr:hypothetical protein [Muribaculaceae bacterium]
MMKNIFSHIEYLLYRHDCVIVPQLGAFVVRQIPAEYDPTESVFLPPRRQILFNPELTHSDGLLAASVARRDNITYEQAAAVVADEVAKIKSELACASAKSPAGDLGLFIRTPHGAITFESAHRYFAVPQLYKLPAISVTTVEEREAMQQQTARTRILPLSAILRVAASIIVLVAIGFLTTTPVAVDENRMHMASLAVPEIKVPEPADEIVPVEITLNIAVPSAEAEPFTIITPLELSRRLASAKINDSDPYYLVVGSTETPRRAQMFMDAHPGVYLETIRHNDYYRIIAASAGSPAELMEIYNNSFKEEFPGAWPCHR